MWKNEPPNVERALNSDMFAYECTYVCMYVHVYIVCMCTCACACVCACVCTCACVHVYVQDLHLPVEGVLIETQLELADTLLLMSEEYVLEEGQRKGQHQQKTCIEKVKLQRLGANVSTLLIQ